MNSYTLRTRLAVGFVDIGLPLPGPNYCPRNPGNSTVDLLHLDGRDLTATPLDERRALARILDGSRLLRSEPLQGRFSKIDSPRLMGRYGTKKR